MPQQVRGGQWDACKLSAKYGPNNTQCEWAQQSGCVYTDATEQEVPMIQLLHVCSNFTPQFV